MGKKKDIFIFIENRAAELQEWLTNQCELNYCTKHVIPKFHPKGYI